MVITETPHLDILTAAFAAAEQAEQAWIDCSCPDGRPSIDTPIPTCEHYRASRAADATLAHARRAVIDADESREWTFCEDGYEYATLVGTYDEAIAHARTAGETGLYDTSSGTVWTDIRVECALTGEAETVTVQIDPDEPECLDAEEHDWQSPIELVGGIKENPGVWGHGGGVIIDAACLRCGAHQITDTWAQRQDTGEQGLTSITYGEPYDLDVLGYIVEERTDGWTVRDASDDTYTRATDEDNAREIAYRCRAGQVSDYEWQYAEE